MANKKHLAQLKRGVAEGRPWNRASENEATIDSEVAIAQTKKQGMEETYVGASVATIFATIALTLAIWTGFYVVTPDTPLSLRETMVVAGLCTAIVLGFKWAWKRRR
jgi:hypothetical protein